MPVAVTTAFHPVMSSTTIETAAALEAAAALDPAAFDPAAFDPAAFEPAALVLAAALDFGSGLGGSGSSVILLLDWSTFGSSREHHLVVVLWSKRVLP